MPAPRARLASWATALCVLIAPDLASADIPIGSFEFELGGVNSLWMGGDEDTHEDADGFCASFGRSFDVVEACSFRLTVDGRGKIGGYVSFTGLLAGNRIAIEGPIKGAQRGDNRSGITRASFQIRLAGSASRGGAALATSVNLAFDGQVDAGGVLNGAWTQTVCYAASLHDVRVFCGPHPWTNGHWTLRLDVELLGDGALGGSAQILFGDDTTCDFTIRGRYNANKDVASLALSPASPAVRGRVAAAAESHPAGRQARRWFRAELQYKLFGVGGTTRRRHGDRRSLPPAARARSRSDRQPVAAACFDGLEQQRLELRDHRDPWGARALTPSLASQSASAASVSVAASGMQLDLVWGQPAAVTSPAPLAAGAGLTVNAMVGSALLQPFRPGAPVLGLPGVVPLAP